MKQEHYVIVGNGTSGNRAADYLREKDEGARITIISDEFFLYYYRHKIREYVLGEIQDDDLVVRSASYYREKRIRLRLGQTVVKLDPDEKVLYLKHMEKVHYTRLLICCGGRPRIPEIYFACRDHFTTLKTLEDARKLRQLLPDLNHIVILGGDLISVRMTGAFLNAGKRVTFIMDENAFWPLEVTEQLRKNFKESITGAGAEIIENDLVASVSRIDDGKLRIATQEGQSLECDLVGAFFGLTPDVEFLMRSGLDIDRGILVNEYLQTSRADVYAAGDCAQVYNPSIRNYWVSIGWGNARRLGELAAHNMLGATDRVEHPPQTVMECQGVKVQSEWWQDLRSGDSDPSNGRQR